MTLQNFGYQHGCPTYRDSGYIRFPGLISCACLSRFRSSLMDVLERLRPGGLHWEKVVPVSVLKESRNPGVAALGMENVPFVIGSLPAVSSDFLELILEEGLWAAAREVLESDDVVYHFSNVTRKPALVGPNMAWHRDYPNEYMCPENADEFFRALIPLELMDCRNGCTEVIPRTHLVTDVFARDVHRDKIVDWEASDAILMNAVPGDVIAIHPKVVHGGRENRSAIDRNLVVIQFGRRTDRFLWKCGELYSGLSRDEIKAADPRTV